MICQSMTPDDTEVRRAGFHAEPLPTSFDSGPDDVMHIGRRDDIQRALETGGTVVALCGVVRTPRRPIRKLPVCADCIAVRNARGGS